MKSEEMVNPSSAPNYVMANGESATITALMIAWASSLRWTENGDTMTKSGWLSLIPLVESLAKPRQKEEALLSSCMNV